MGRHKKTDKSPRAILNVAFSPTMYAQLAKAAADRTKLFDRTVSMNELVRQAVDTFLRTQETRGKAGVLGGMND